MKTFTIGEQEQNQRLDKYLHRRLPAAPSSFLYKMLRRKNITLNGKKADGGEKLQTGDVVKFFLSDDTYAKFSGMETASSGKCSAHDSSWNEYLNAYRRINSRYSFCPILYEDRNVCLVHKLPGILSQKSAPGDISMNEWLIGYLAESGKISPESLAMFHPSVCNRLDRNTGGILICAVSLPGSQTMTALLRDRTLHKYYRMVVCGTGLGNGRITGYLRRNAKTGNTEFSSSPFPGGTYSETRFCTVDEGARLSLLEAELVTGKTHQLRAHLAASGHPIAGDVRYGDPELNEQLRRRFGIQWQMLYAVRLSFPKIEGACGALSGREFRLEMPDIYRRSVREFR